MKMFLLLATLIASATMIRALPVQTDSGSHAILTAQTTSKHGKLYVSGTVSGLQPGLRHSASHVEVDLVDARGQTIASVTDKIGKSSRHPRAAGQREERFVASFPGEVARQAISVRVVFHNHEHRSCDKGC
ncbi:MAG: hypothetical protein ACOYMS_11570 [Terrimicrobiaceae bacterium]